MQGIRRFGFMGRVEAPIALHRGWWANPLQQHPAYAAAKAGDPFAAVTLVAALGLLLATRVRDQIGPGCTFVAPHAEEVLGRNAIPQTLAVFLARGTDGVVDENIVQSVRAFHTGATRAERLVSRPLFDGPVAAGNRYVVVDDVTTSGSTLAELADHIHHGGGEVVGAVVFVDASRTGRLAPNPKIIQTLKGGRDDVLREVFGIDPVALTADEAQYVNGFRTPDALRDRGLAARQARADRLRDAGVRGDGEDDG